jgi:beta-lactamase class A
MAKVAFVNTMLQKDNESFAVRSNLRNRKLPNMLKILQALFIYTCLPALLFSQNNLSMDALKQRITDTLTAQKGFFAVAFKDLSSGKELFINEYENFHAASTMKVPVMIEVYKQAALKKFSLKDSVTIINEFKSIVDGSLFHLDSADDSEFELYKQVGEKKTVYDVVYKMIILSSNFATNLMIQLVNAKNVTATMRTLGAKDIQVLRGVEDQKAFDKGIINTVTAYDLMLLFEQIAKGKAVSKKACKEMIRILLDQRFNDIIPAKLPPDVKVAHKTGWITGLHHDAGIIFLPDGRKYILVLLSKKLDDEKAGVNAMASVSEMIYKYLNP